MWGESSKNCEINCQCSGLITEKFKINSGNSATKRKQEDSLSHNFKLRMNPHTIDFTKSPISPIFTPTKRRILGEIQIPQNRNRSPGYKSPVNQYGLPNVRSPVNQFGLSIIKSPVNQFGLSNVKSPVNQFVGLSNIKSPLAAAVNSQPAFIKSPMYMSSGSVGPSPVSRSKKSRLSRVFEERTKFKMANKENENNESLLSETLMKFDVEEETRDFSFEDRFKDSRKVTWPTNKLDFTDAIQKPSDIYVPEKELHQDEDETLLDLETEFDADNFDQCSNYEIISTDSPNVISRGRTSSSRKVTARNFIFGAPLADNEQSTSFNRPNHVTRMLNFVEEEFDFASPSLKKCNAAKKSLKFTESPSKFTGLTKSPQGASFEPAKMCFNEISPKTENTPSKYKTELSVGKAFRSRELNFSETSKSNSNSLFSESTRLSFTPSKHETRKLSFNETDSKSIFSDTKSFATPFKLRHERSDSSIGSMSITPPKVRLYTSESTTSMESGFISELEEPFLEIEESNSPKVENFNVLLSGTIKNNIINDRNFVKKPLNRSLSFNPEVKGGLLSISESPREKRCGKRVEDREIGVSKRRKCNEQRPVLQRAFSENNASIMSALARSATEPDLIGDFSQTFALPLTCGNHSDLKSISCETLANLIQGNYQDLVGDFQIIDCRYPYEFDGGHIRDAVNYYTPTQILSLLNKPLETRQLDAKRSILVFHCEFSLERGPKLSRFLRSSDRAQNKDNYPSLHYPEIYLLHEGYRSFYAQYPELCSDGYTAMLDPRHKTLLRTHRGNLSRLK